MFHPESFLTEGVPPNIQELERVASSIGSHDRNISEQCDGLINQFKEREDSWLYTPDIIAQSRNLQLLTVAYGILSDFLLTKWQIPDDETKAGMRQFIQNSFFEMATGIIPPPLHGYIFKMVVCYIIADFPEGCPDFVNQILDLSFSDEQTLPFVIRFFSETMDEILGENAESNIIYRRIQDISNALEEHAEKIFRLVDHVIKTRISDTVIMKPTLSLLKYFIKWIPPELIVENNIFQTVIEQALPNEELVSQCLNFLAGVYELANLPEALIQLCPDVFKVLIDVLIQYIPEDQDFSTIDDYTVTSLALCLTTFLTKQAEHIEIEQLATELQTTVGWIMAIMAQSVPIEAKITCTEFWKNIGHRWKRDASSSVMQGLYIPYFPDITRIIVNTMSKPDELFIRIDEEQQVVRQLQFNTPEDDLFKIQKDALIYFANYDYGDTIDAIDEVLSALQSDFDANRYYSLCFSLASISGVNSDKKDENATLLRFIQAILGLTQSAPDGTPVKALISGGLMYILSQYPAFLSSNYQLFITLITKLFEFMHSENDAIREMAVNSFSQLSKSAAKRFVEMPPDKEGRPFIYDVLESVNDIASDLGNDDWISTFFGSIAKIINTNPRSMQKREQLAILVQPLNEQLNQVYSSLNIENEDQINSLIFLLNCNAKIAHWISGGDFDVQLEQIWGVIIELYNGFASSLIPLTTTLENPETQPIFILYKQVKSAICQILSEYIQRTNNTRKHSDIIIPAVMQNIVSDYSANPPITCVPEVLDLLTTMFKRMSTEEIGQHVPQLFETVFQKTFEMIYDPTFESYVNFRVSFYKFEAVMVSKYIAVLVNAPEQEFNGFVETIKYGISHPTNDVCSLSISIMEDLFKKMKENCNQDVYNLFVQTYFIPIVTHTIEMITDTMHRFVFDAQAKFLRTMLTTNNPEINNPDAITQSILPLFPNKDPAQVFTFISLLIQNSNEVVTFNNLLREFMISTKQFSPYDKRIDLNLMEQKQNQLRDDELVFRTPEVENFFEP